MANSANGIALLHVVAETGMIHWANSLVPMKLAVDLRIGIVVDAGLAMSHQTRIIKLPVLIAVRTEPVSIAVMILLLKANSEPIFAECPQVIDQAIF